MAELRAGMRQDLTLAESNGARPVDFATDDLDDSSVSAAGGMNLRPILRTLQRKALLVLGVTGVAATLAWRLSEPPDPVYVGDFQIQVEPANSVDKLESVIPTEDGGPDNLDYPTQLEILQSRTLLEDIVAEVRNSYPNFTLAALEKNLIVQRLIGENRRLDVTKIIEISYQSSDPEQIMTVLNAAEDRYLKYSLEERTTGIDEAIKFIDQQSPALVRKANASQAEIQQLQQQYELIDPTAKGEQLYTQISLIENQLLETERELPELRQQYADLQQKLNLEPEDALAASALSDSPTIAQYRTQIAEVDSQLARDSAIFTEDSPEIRQLREQRQNLIQLLEQETQRTLESSPASLQNPAVYSFQNSTRQQLISQLVETENQIKVLEVRLRSLQQTKSRLEEEARAYPVVARRYNEAQKELEVTNQLLDEFRTQRQKLQVERAQDNEPWQIIDEPKLQTDSTGEYISVAEDSRQKTMLASILGGLLLGSGLAILLEKIHNIFYTPEDLQESVSLPMLGVVPPYRQSILSSLFRLSGAQDKSVPLRQSEFEDAFDNLYANIRFVYADFPLRSVAVCSAESGDGKSTVALHLAETIAGMGQKVLLVDANLRDPQLHNNLGLPNQKGLSDLLTDSQVAPKILIQPSGVMENLFVLTAGSPSSLAIKLMGSQQMLKIVEDLQNSFDLVIYDTPELHHYTDAVFLSGHLDGMLVVVGINKTHSSVVKQTLEKVNKFNLPCLGVIGNHIKQNSAAKVPIESV
ncbi:MAG: GumC family protein [Microcoleaceae cyanobacterium]